MKKETIQYMDEGFSFANTAHVFKGMSPLWPSYIRKEQAGTVYYSTILRFERNGIWYRQHHLESVDPNNFFGYIEPEKALAKLIESVYNTIYLCEPNDVKDIHGNLLIEKDPDQTSEAERLKAIIFPEIIGNKHDGPPKDK